MSRLCQGPEVYAAASGSQGEARHEHGAAARDSLGAEVTDPVCGMTVDPEHAAGHADHGGHRYWFCSAGCRDTFVADPDRYNTAQSTS